MAKAKRDLEAQLLGGESLKPEKVSIQQLELEDQMDQGDDGLIFFNEDGTMGRESLPTRKLEGAEAMLFLNLPARKFNRLTKGDLSRIRWKFKDLFEKWIKENKDGRNENKLFWDQIRVRVINKNNVGKMTKGSKAAGIEPAPYQGDIYTGEAIKAFLPETRFSNADGQYILQLLSIVVTEELESV